MALTYHGPRRPSRGGRYSEFADYRDHGHKARDLKVFTCHGVQSSIDAIVDAMNDADHVARSNAPAREG